MLLVAAKWDAMEMRAKHEMLVLILVAFLHLIAQVAHSYAHQIANVMLSPSQLVFIVLVVTILPWLALVVA